MGGDVIIVMCQGIIVLGSSLLGSRNHFSNFNSILPYLSMMFWLSTMRFEFALVFNLHKNQADQIMVLLKIDINESTG